MNTAARSNWPSVTLVSRPNVDVDTRTDDTHRAWLHYESAVNQAVRLLLSSAACVKDRDFTQAERDRHAAYKMSLMLSRKLEEAFAIAYGEPDEACDVCASPLFACECPVEREES